MGTKDSQTDSIPFNRAFIAGRELYYIAQAVSNGELKGDGPFTKKCNRWLEEKFGVKKALLTHSCTGALEMAALLIGLEEGDEVIMPSFTFTSTANAFLLRGAKPVFIDIRPDTLNIDEQQIEAAITSNTKAICAVHYAGVGCEMDTIMDIAQRHGLYVIEDAAHAIMANYKGRPLGSIGHLATFSFHETKNYNCGEGGALLINADIFSNRAEIIREKGTNRSQFFRGEIDKYSWVDIGSSYLPSEIIAAFLYGQLEHAEAINQERLDIWNSYYSVLKPFEDLEQLRLPCIPTACEHNAHLFYLLLNSEEERNDLLTHLKNQRIGAVFHYIPLHTSRMGKVLGYSTGELPHSEDLANRLLRLPLYCGMTQQEISSVTSCVASYFESKYELSSITAC